MKDRQCSFKVLSDNFLLPGHNLLVLLGYVMWHVQEKTGQMLGGIGSL